MSDRLTHSYKREAEPLRGLVVQLRAQVRDLKAQAPRKAVQVPLPVKRNAGQGAA